MNEMLELWVEIQAPSGGMVRLMKMNIRLEELVGVEYRGGQGIWRDYRCANV